MVESYSLFLLSISTAGIWSLAPSPGPRFLQGASHAMMRTQHFRIQNESTLHAICSNGSPNTDICFTASQCLTPVLLLKQCYDCFSFQICFWSLQICFIFIYCCFLDFQKVPLSHLSNAAHKFLTCEHKGPLSPVDSLTTSGKKKGGGFGGFMLNIKRETPDRGELRTELRWTSLPPARSLSEWKG